MESVASSLSFVGKESFFPKWLKAEVMFYSSPLRHSVCYSSLFHVSKALLQTNWTWLRLFELTGRTHTADNTLARASCRVNTRLSHSTAQLYTNTSEQCPEDRKYHREGSFLPAYDLFLYCPPRPMRCTSSALRMRFSGSWFDLQAFISLPAVSLRCIVSHLLTQLFKLQRSLPYSS